VVTFEQFPSDLRFALPWQTFVKGSGQLAAEAGVLRFSHPQTHPRQYSNAQLDDYQTLKRADFLWQPPLTMTVRARFSHPSGELVGTAGFGFWNDPFMMTDWRRPTLPRAIWFFYSSPPSNMKLDLHTPGHGWKVGTLDAWHWPFFALLPTAPLAVPLMNIAPLYRLCWPLGQRSIKVSEALVPVAMTEWHSYTLEWQQKTARFSVDGQVILACHTAPRGPLGFVMWLDNQYMVVTPWGRFASGLLASTGEQWMEVSRLEMKQDLASSPPP